MRSDRRHFLHELLAAGGLLAGVRLSGLGAPTPVPLPAGQVPNQGRVVAVQDAAVFRGRGELDVAVVKQMLDRGIIQLTGQPEPASAWASLFRRSERVGLKVNCIAGRGISTRVELVEAIVAGLISAGLQPENIVVWDRTSYELSRAGFRLNRNGSGLRCLGTDDTLAGYESRLAFAGEVGSCFSRLLTRFCDALINVPVLKDHDLAGMTGALKNYYGAIHNPNRYHDDHCDPYVADLNTSPLIRSKERLVVCDALRVQYHGGPSYKPNWIWDCGGLLLGQDPVAVDSTGCRWIEGRRRQASLPSLVEEERDPKWLRTAARYGLGTADTKAIQVQEV